MVLDIENIFHHFARKKYNVVSIDFIRNVNESFLKLHRLKPSEALTDSTLSVLVSSVITLLLSPISTAAWASS